MRRRPLILIAFIAIVLISATAVHKGSARKPVTIGNEAYNAGNLEEALKEYDEASIDNPESPHLYFNRGAVHYQQEDYEKAREAFENAALKSVEPGLESLARYNLGNCAFREAERQRDSDPKKAIESCDEAITHYREALDKNRELTKAGENIEIVRIYKKALLDELAKQQEQEQQQQEQQEDLAKKLKELIERQQKALTQNQGLAAQIQQRAALSNIVQRIQTLATNQLTLHDDTRGVSQQVQHNLDQSAQAAALPPAAAGAATNQVGGAAAPQLTEEQREKLNTVKEHVDKAVGQQQQAAQKLTRNQLPPAAPNQQTAVEELTKALEALQDENQDQQQQQQQNDDPQEGDEENEEEEKDSQQQQQQGQEENEDEESGEKEEEQRQAAKAEDILNDEKDNRERRQPMQIRGYRAVDKNW